MQYIAILGIGFLIAYFVFSILEREYLKSEIFKLQSKIEKIEIFRKKPFFKSNDINLYGEIYDLKSRAETLGFCFQCPLYQEKNTMQSILNGGESIKDTVRKVVQETITSDYEATGSLRKFLKDLELSKHNQTTLADEASELKEFQDTSESSEVV